MGDIRRRGQKKGGGRRRIGVIILINCVPAKGSGFGCWPQAITSCSPKSHRSSSRHFDQSEWRIHQGGKRIRCVVCTKIVVRCKKRVGIISLCRIHTGRPQQLSFVTKGHRFVDHRCKLTEVYFMTVPWLLVTRAWNAGRLKIFGTCEQVTECRMNSLPDHRCSSERWGFVLYLFRGCPLVVLSPVFPRREALYFSRLFGVSVFYQWWTRISPILNG